MPRLFDFTQGWNETDPRSEITRTANQITVTTAALAANTDHGFVWQQEPDGALSADWDYTGSIRFETGSTNGFRVSPIMMSDEPVGQLTTAAGTPDYWGQCFTLLNSSGTLYFQLNAYYPTATGANAAQNMTPNPVAGTTYYWRFRRDETTGFGTLYLDVYTDAAMTDLFGSASLALAYAKHDFTYLHASNGFASAANAAGTARIGSLRDMRGWSALVTGGTTNRWAPRQHMVWNDGRYIHCYGWQDSDGTPLVQYADPVTTLVGSTHAVPGMPAPTNVRGLDAFFNFVSGYADTLVFTSSASTSQARPIAKNDLGLTSYAQRTALAIAVLTDASTLIDDNDYGWVAGRNAAGDIVAYRGGGPYGETAYSLSLTVEATSATGAAPQLVGYESGDVGLLCGIDGALTYRHWDYATETWGSPETVISDLGGYDNFRGVVSRDETLTVQYRRSGAAGLLAKRRTSGTFGAEFTISADIRGAATDYYHASCADVGRDDVVYAFYVNATDLVYRVITDGTVGAEQVLVAGVRLSSSGLTAPPFDGHRMLVAYHHSSTVVFAEWVDVTPVQSYAGTGTVVGAAGWNNHGTVKVVTDGTLSLVFVITRGGYAVARMRDEDTGEWVGAEATFSKRYWDNHDTMFPFKAADGKLYFFEGGRDHGAPDRNTPLTLKRTPAALSTYANAAAVLAALQDISPPTTGYYDVTSGNRGYKQIVVGNDGVLYYLMQHYETATGTSRVLMAEYRSSAWSTPVVLVEYQDDKPEIGNVYTFGYCDGGEESPAQTSIHVVWQVRDETTTTTGGSLLCIESNYAKVVPQGGGAFKAYRVDGVEMTLPMTLEPDKKDLIYSGRPASATLAPPARANATTYAVNDVVNGGNGHLYRVSAQTGATDSAPPTWPTNHYATVVDGGVTWEEHGLCGTVYAETGTQNGISPATGRFLFAGALRNFVQGDGPACTLTELRLWKWTGTAWTWSTLQNSAMPWRCFIDHALSVSGSAIFVPFKKVVSGIEEIVLYSSTDETTWGMDQVTSGSPVGHGPPRIAPRTAGTVTLGWFHWVHRDYGEAVFKALALAPVSFWVRVRRGAGPWSEPSNRVTVHRV